MNKSQKIIYDLLFSEEEELLFDLTSLLEYVEDYPDLTDSIVRKVNRGGVKILEDTIEVENDIVFWRLKIKRS